MATIRGFLVSSGDQPGLPRVELDGMHVVMRQSIPDSAQPGLAFELRMIPAEAIYLADRLARGARALDGAWLADPHGARPEYVPLPPEGA